MADRLSLGSSKNYASALAAGAILQAPQIPPSVAEVAPGREGFATSPWPELAGLLLILLVSLLGLSVVVEDRLSRWIRYFRKVAVAHSRGKASARASGLGRIPSSLIVLAESMNRMADVIDDRTHRTEEELRARAALLHEIHHRVKNNFAIVAGFLGLHKRALSGRAKEDVRFVEEHVQSMATAYRVAYTADDSSKVSISDVVAEVLTGLQDIAGCPGKTITLRTEELSKSVNIDQVIAVSLYLAYKLPPYFDACKTLDTRIDIRIDVRDNQLLVRFSKLPQPGPIIPELRHRLANAYLRQLNATFEADDRQEHLLVVPLFA